MSTFNDSGQVTDLHQEQNPNGSYSATATIKNLEFTLDIADVTYTFTADVTIKAKSPTGMPFVPNPFHFHEFYNIHVTGVDF